MGMSRLVRSRYILNRSSDVASGCRSTMATCTWSFRLPVNQTRACVRACFCSLHRTTGQVGRLSRLTAKQRAGRACFIHVAGVIDETDRERYGTERAALCTVQRATATTATGVVVNGHADVGVAGRRDRRARRAGRRRDERQRCIDHALPTERNWVAASE